jgi:hypothetical protein
MNSTTTDNTSLSNNDFISTSSENRRAYLENLRRRQEEHLRNVEDDNFQVCLHDSCPSCLGTGVRHDGSPCIHNIACSCSKCSPRY